MFNHLRNLVQLTHAHRIARRYFVTNGFDGVLTMLGILMGFKLNAPSSNDIVIGACSGAAVALFMSGISSAYISESAEKQHELRELEKSLITSLHNSIHAQAAKWMPWLIAFVNGISPLALSMLILTPLVFTDALAALPLNALDASLSLAWLMCFLLGAFLGRLSGRFWFWTGMRAMLIALLTTGIVFLFHQSMHSN